MNNQIVKFENFSKDDFDSYWNMLPNVMKLLWNYTCESISNFID